MSFDSLSRNKTNIGNIEDILSESSKDMKAMKENMKKLKGLSDDDKSENGMLRSRINEQGELIMILKQKADDTTMRMRTVERINNELIEFRDSAKETIDMEIRKYRILDKRFQELAENHDEMIKIKDEYKNVNKDLRQENLTLKEENRKLFSKAIQEKDEEITSLDKKYHVLKEQHCGLENRLRQAQQEFKLKEDMYKHKIDLIHETTMMQIKELQTKLSDTEERLKGATYKLQNQIESKMSGDTEANQKIQQLTKQKDEMLDLAMSRGKLVHKEQGENKMLLNRIQDMEKSVKDMQLKFEREAAAVNANLQVKKLRDELYDSDFRYQEMTREFEAFKKHSNNLLQKERDMNEKLRHLAS